MVDSQSADVDLEKLYAEIGKITITFGAIDTGYVLLFASVLSPCLPDTFESSYAAPILFLAKSREQRQALIKATFKTRFAWMLDQPRHTNARRAVDYLETAINKAFAEVDRVTWVRNLAAHGSVYKGPNGVAITPVAFDEAAASNLTAKGYPNGMNAKDLSDKVAPAHVVKGIIWELARCTNQLIHWQPMPSAFLQIMNETARDLGMKPLRLADPNDGPPRRGRRGNG